MTFFGGNFLTKILSLVCRFLIDLFDDFRSATQWNSNKLQRRHFLRRWNYWPLTSAFPFRTASISPTRLLSSSFHLICCRCFRLWRISEWIFFFDANGRAMNSAALLPLTALSSTKPWPQAQFFLEPLFFFFLLFFFILNISLTYSRQVPLLITFRTEIQSNSFAREIFQIFVRLNETVDRWFRATAYATNKSARKRPVIKEKGENNKRNQAKRLFRSLTLLLRVKDVDL